MQMRKLAIRRLDSIRSREVIGKEKSISMRFLTRALEFNKMVIPTTESSECGFEFLVPN